MICKVVLFFSLAWVWTHNANCYYSSRRCYGTGDCHLMTKNQDGGFDDSKHQWLVECNDGEGTVAIRDDDSHFEGLSGLWCAFLFPLKQSTRGTYPYYPTCIVRNLTAGEYHCHDTAKETNGTASAMELFVSGVYKEPNNNQVFVPSLMKCCQMPTGYQIDYTRCYYKKTFDRFGEHYTGEWLVKCDTHHLITGIGKDENPWDTKEHFTWIQCCPFYYAQQNHQPTEQEQYYLSKTKFPYPVTMTSLGQPRTSDNNLVQVLGYLAGSSSPSLTGMMPRVDLPGNYISSPMQYLTGPGTGEKTSQNFQVSNDRSVYTSQLGTPGTSYAPATGTYNFPSTAMFKQPYPFTTTFSDFPRNMIFFNQTNYTPAPPQPTTSTGPPMSPIQHAANLAAYKQFISTFSQLMSTYTNQQKQSTQAAPPRSIDGEAGSTDSTLPLGLASAQAADGYVQPPLPSGLQNYMLLSSNNPGAALSSLFNGDLSVLQNQPQEFSGASGAAAGWYVPVQGREQSQAMYYPFDMQQLTGNAASKQEGPFWQSALDHPVRHGGFTGAAGTYDGEHKYNISPAPLYQDHLNYLRNKQTVEHAKENTTLAPVVLETTINIVNSGEKPANSGTLSTNRTLTNL